MKTQLYLALLNVQIWILLLVLIVSMPFQFAEFVITNKKKIKQKVENLFYKTHYKIQDFRKN